MELLKQGKYCGEEPWTLLAILAEDALNRRDPDAAERYATAMLIQPVERPADLRRAGTLLRMEAASARERTGQTADKVPALDGEPLGPAAAVLFLSGGGGFLPSSQRAAR